ncbi:MAG: aldehyde dehydrogenase family protein, partial [Rhodanobacter sp.]
MPMLRLANLINGRLQAPHSNQWLDVHEPATGKVFAHCPDSSAADVANAVHAAAAAAPSWAATPIEQRAHRLHQLATLIETRQAEFAALESRDSGKPLALAQRLDIPRAVSNLCHFAASIQGWGSQSHAMENGHPGAGAINYTLRQPVGVVGCISPWNLPLYLFTWKIAPALASGNTVVAKPSEVTPCTAALLGELSIEAGFPPGVLNIVQGRGPTVGQAIVENPQVNAISFTGSTATGARIASVAA